MKSKIYSTACAIALSAIMTVQTLGPAASLVIADTIDEEPEVTVESTVTNDDEDPVIVVESSDETTSSDPEYVEETTDLTDTTTDETSDEEEIVSTATNTDPTEVVETEETEAVDETIAETEESEVTEPTDEELDEELEEELEEIEYIEFDHYYSEINEAAVSTSDLFVITGDSSVFTRNTNVVSNYDDAYIIECSSVEEARFVYSYYIDKVEFITDMSAVVSVATDDADLDTTDPVDVTEPLEEDIRNIPDEEILTEETQDYVDEPTAIPDTEETTTSNTDETVVETTADTTVETSEPVEQEPDVADLSDLNNGNDAIANLNDIDTVHNDYSGYIALIDTGANAHANFTVLGGDTFDYNGHGTSMLGYIRSENPQAQVVSIKVSEDGSASAADIYAGFRLAIDLNVSVINFSMTAPDIAKNAVIRDIIQEALDAGIVVIGAAGNNAISATHFIPGCIDGVITVGAVDTEGIKVRNSNYNADYYVTADSTSEAAARYTGLYTVGTADYAYMVFDQVIEDDLYAPEGYDWAEDVAEELTNNMQADLGYGYVTYTVNEDAEGNEQLSFVYFYDETYHTDDFVVSGYPTSDATINLNHEVAYNVTSTSCSGTCNFVSVQGGKGYANNFDGELGRWLNAAGLGSTDIWFICSKNFGESASDHAHSLESSSNMNYVAYYYGNKWTIMIGTRAGVSQPVWRPVSDQVSYTISGSGSGRYLYVTVGGTTRTVDLQQPGASVVATIQDLVRTMTTIAEYGGNRGPCEVIVSNTGVGTHRANRSYYHTDDTQVYESEINFPGHEAQYGEVSISKIDAHTNSGLAGATITLTGALDSDWGISGASNPSYNGSVLTFTSTTSIARVRGLLPNTTYTFAETAAPPASGGYTYERVVSVATFRTNASGKIDGSTVSFSGGGDTSHWSFTDGTATFQLVNGEEENHDYSSIAVLKTWDPQYNSFFRDTQFLMFSIGYRGSQEDIVQYGWDWTTFTNGRIRTPNIGDGQAPVRWITSAESARAGSYNGAGAALYSGGGGHYTGGDGTYYQHLEGGHFVDNEGGSWDWNAELLRLPFGYYLITESWQDAYISFNGRQEFITAANQSGWYEMANDPSTGYHKYGIVICIDSQGTWLCDLEGNKISMLPVEGGVRLTSVYNGVEAGGFDLSKVDVTNTGVSHVSFELRGDTDGYPVVARGHIHNPSSPDSTTVIDGQTCSVYDVDWNYTDGYEFYYSWCGDNSEWHHDLGTLPTNAEYVDQLIYGNYWVYEWIGYYDTNGRWINEANAYKTPDGWTRYTDPTYGTYFARRVEINSAYSDEPMQVQCANEINGRIDVNKVNITGGPLSDLSFEIRNSRNVVIANGVIPAGAEPETTGTGNLSDYTYSVNWTSTSASLFQYTNRSEAITGLGTFTVREYIPVSAVANIEDLRTSTDWTYGGLSGTGNWYYFYKTITITEANADELQVANITNELARPVCSTTMTDFANRQITVVGEVIEFTDTVAYDNVYIGGKYKMYATLMDAATGEQLRDANGNVYVGESDWFTTTASSGTVNVSFLINTADLVRANVDATTGVVTYSPRAVVCFESMCIEGGREVANHNDLTDRGQTVTIPNPEIGTTLTSVQNVRDDACVGETVEFIDTVTYTNLHVGETYYLEANVYDQATGRILKGPDGQPFTSGRIEFVPEQESGTVEVPITINTASIIEADLDNTTGIVTMHTKNIVCYEYLYSASEILIGGHTDINDEGQTITITPPDVHTTFVDVQTEEHETVSGRVVEVVDTVTYTNLHVGETYNLTCYLFDQTSGQQLVYSNGDPVVGTQEFVARTENGTVQVRFTIDTSDLQVNFFNYVRHTYVAFEYLRTVNDILIAGHTAIDDHYQWVTPNLPRITTAVIDDQSGTQEGRLGSEVPFTDTVYYNNLNEGEWYQIRGRVVSQNDANQVWATNIIDFRATGRSGYVEVPFVIDTSEICQGSNDANIVCFEQLWQLDTEGTGRGEVMLDKHEDLTDENQTIYLTPRLETQMMDPVTNSQYGMIGEDVEFIDTITYHRLRIGETYTVTGVLMDHQLNAPILDENGQVITASTTFVPDATEGTVEVHYRLNTLRLIQEIGTVIDGVLIDAPREIVSFETVTSQSGFDFAIHADIEDDLQTIILGDIHSSAGDIQTSTRWCAAGLTTIQDTVHYRGLGPVEYTVVGSLHLVDYDEDGNPVDGGLIPARTGEVTETTYTWTPTNHEGDIVLDYRLDTSRYEGRDIIVFEELYYNGIRIIGHENYADVNGGFGMNNYEQTVHIPSVHTNAFSFQTGAQLLAVDESATINDFVYYGNVEVGRSYYVEGQLWACYTDENGFIHSTALTAEQGGRQCSDTFTATAKSGSVEIQFTIDSTVLQGLHYDYIVVTERLIAVGSGVCVGNHGSLTDQDQTIYIPDVHTTASTTVGRTLPETSTEPVMVTVSDRVFYENLIPNKSYTVVGNLQYARTDANGNITESGALVQNGTPVTASLTFTPTSPSGYVDLTFNVDARSIMNQGYNRIVAFEDLYFGPEGVRVAVHADITDEEQTVRIPDMETTALGVNGRHTVAASANTTIRDTVAYYGLTPGREYRLETDLMSSRTNGSIAHVTTVFTPDTPDGVVTVELTADLSGYQPGDRVVVFEDLYDQPTGLLIKSHMDWDDEDQTVTITDHPETGVLDSNGFGYIVLAIATVVAGGFGIFLVNSKKSKKEKLDSENPTES